MSRILLVARESFLYHSTNPLDMAEVLAADGHEVTVAAPFAPEAQTGNAARGFRLAAMPPLREGSNRGFIRHALSIARRLRPDVVIGVNPVGFVAADLIHSLRLARRAVYYGLEMFLPADNPRSVSLRWISLRARSMDLIAMTGDERADQMQQAFHLARRPFVVANAAIRAIPAAESDLRARVAAAGCSAKELVIYVGSVGEATRLLEATRASRLWQRDAALVLVAFGGSPGDRAALETEVRASPGRAVWLPPISGSREAVIRLAAGADAGLVLYDHRLGNNRNVMLATPNKLYDYFAAGLPIIASDTPSLVRIVEGEGLGACCNPAEPREIAAATDRVLSQREALAARVRDAFSTRYNYATQAEPLRKALAEWTS